MREAWGKVTVSSVKISVPDITDGAVVVQSSVAQSHPLPRGFSDEFSFGESDLVIINNRGGDKATVRLQAILTPQDGLYFGSTRRGGWLERSRETRTVRMQPGEVITIRSLHAIEPHSRTRRSPEGVPIHPGQRTPAP
jgi:hypothetical protein